MCELQAHSTKILDEKSITSEQNTRMLRVNSKIQIPSSEFQFDFTRSSGPGGQNVNKVSSKAQLRWYCTRSKSISEDVRLRFLESFASKITKTGEILITSDVFRDQLRNKDECLEKLARMLLLVAFAPKVRRKTKPSRSSVMKGQQSKRLHGAKKKNRKIQWE